MANGPINKLSLAKPKLDPLNIKKTQNHNRYWKIENIKKQKIKQKLKNKQIRNKTRKKLKQKQTKNLKEKINKENRDKNTKKKDKNKNLFFRMSCSWAILSLFSFLLALFSSCVSAIECCTEFSRALAWLYSKLNYSSH